MLATRPTLYWEGISESPICNLCNAKEHNYIASPANKLNLWTLFQDWWFQKTNETITLSTSHIPVLSSYGWHERDKTLASPKLLFAYSQILHFLHKPSWRCFRFWKLSIFYSLKTWDSKRICDYKKALPKFFLHVGCCTLIWCTADVYG